jgi:hypothetical protein
MSLINKAKEDWQRFTSDTDAFGVAIKLAKPDESAEVDLSGLATKHHIGFDTDGNLVNTKNAHISFAEALLPEDFVIRNEAGEVYLDRYLVSFVDSTGVEKKYVIREWFPDETVGMITCILGTFE